MTNAVFVRYGEATYHISIHGHADYAKRGADIVCSACSQLTYTLAQAFRRLEADGMLREYHESITEDGSAVFIVGVRHREDMLLRAETIAETIADGYRLLADKYQDNVSVEYERKDIEP